MIATCGSTSSSAPFWLAVAHALAPRIDLAWLASSYDIPHLHPCGSHPLLDPEYGSHDLAIRHRDAGLSRIDKLRIVAGWETAFQNFRVWSGQRAGQTQLRAAARSACAPCWNWRPWDCWTRPALSPTMPCDPAWLDAFRITIRVREPFYEELITPLRRRGRSDLAEKIEKKLTERD